MILFLCIVVASKEEGENQEYNFVVLGFKYG